MLTLTNDRILPVVPLEEEDWQMLADLFEPVATEDLNQIESAFAAFTTAPLEDSEETGW